MSFNWKEWVQAHAEQAVQYAEQKARESANQWLSQDKKKVAADWLYEELEKLDDKIPVLGAFMDFPIVDRLERWAVDQAVELAWGKMTALGKL